MLTGDNMGGGTSNELTDDGCATLTLLLSVLF